MSGIYTSLVVFCLLALQCHGEVEKQSSVDAFHKTFDGAVVSPDVVSQHVGEFVEEQLKDFSMEDAVGCRYNPTYEKIIGSAFESDCQQCVVNAAICVVSYSMKKWEEFCSNAESDFWGRICKASEEEKEVTIGMMIQRIHPMTLGWAYCLGKEACSGHGTSPRTVLDAIQERIQHIESPRLPNFITRIAVLDNQLDSLVDAPAMRHSIMGSRALHPLMGNVQTRMQQCAQPQECEIEEDGSVEKFCCNKKHECSCCASMGAQYVMHRVVGLVKTICGKTQCPHMRAVCAAAKKHYKVAYGYLLGTVEPWKYSFGACAATSTCDIPSLCFKLPHSHNFKTSEDVSADEM